MNNNKHIVFDAYGTLFDLSQALAPAVGRLGEHAQSVLARWRILQLEYSWLAALRKQYADFEQITRQAFEDALAEESIIDPPLVDALIDGFKKVQCYNDAQQTLTSLRDSGFVTAILSNGSPSILQSAVSHAGIGDQLDRILSVDAVQTYKPSPDVYALVTEEFNLTPEEVLFVSSNWWDVDGARAFGFKVIWIDRKTYSWPVSFDTPETIIHSLSELLDIDLSSV